MIRTVLPAIAVLALTGVIYEEVALALSRTPAPPLGRPVTLDPGSRADGGAAAAEATGARLTEVLARPLFSPDRRPIESAHGVAGLSRLSGIVVAGSRRLAIFAAAADGRPIVAEEGTHIGNYEVRSIADGGVTVVGPNGAAVIRPVFDPAAPQAKPVAQPIRPPATNERLAPKGG